MTSSGKKSKGSLNSTFLSPGPLLSEAGEETNSSTLSSDPLLSEVEEGTASGEAAAAPSGAAGLNPVADSAERTKGVSPPELGDRVSHQAVGMV